MSKESRNGLSNRETKAVVPLADGGHVAKSMTETETSDPATSLMPSQKETGLRTGDIDPKIARQKNLKKAIEILQNKLAAGANANDLREAMKGQLAEAESDIADLPDDEPLTIRNAIAKAQLLRDQIWWLQSK